MAMRHCRNGRHCRLPSGPILVRQCEPAIGVKMAVVRGRGIGAPLVATCPSWFVRQVVIVAIGKEIDVKVSPWGMRNLDYFE